MYKSLNVPSNPRRRGRRNSLSPFKRHHNLVVSLVALFLSSCSGEGEGRVGTTLSKAQSTGRNKQCIWHWLSKFSHLFEPAHSPDWTAKLGLRIIQRQQQPQSSQPP
ncbi:hypothetical protein LY78DRAFT_289277 [Colletotrichum sublineola]|nr:hypothetical protein LY78DRAFT_289277 [Colletotrichum sublineola]